MAELEYFPFALEEAVLMADCSWRFGAVPV